MELNEVSIQKLIQGKLSTIEAKQIIALLDENPEWIENYFTEDEWGSLKEAEIDKISVERLRLSFEEIKSKAYDREVKEKTKSRLIYMTIAAATVAAAVLLFFIKGLWLPSYRISPNEISNNLSFDSLHVFNNTDTLALIALSDGSSIGLNPQSNLSYLKKFPKERRVIKLVGTAFFKVAKDKQRPFEVQAAGFSTVALGTSFRVAANKNDNKVTVQLYSGKVVISKTDSATGKRFNNVFLYPNQQLTINTATFSSEMVQINQTIHTQDNVETLPTKTLEWNKYITTTHLQFDNTPLVSVFAVLQHQYGITINANVTDVKGIIFSGTFKKGDNVQTILATITSINHLNLLKSGDDHYKITK
jgi:ferric-dicitrate binding protein FerR (iron transport regulator)